MYKGFKQMPVWQKAMEIAEQIFKLTEIFPKKEDFGLTSQIRRSALSISANIAEAYGRNHRLDKINFYYYARGSLLETQSHLEYAKRVRYLRENNSLELKLNNVHKELNKIILTLKKTNN